MSRKLYDFSEAKNIIDQRIESIESASLGMHEDWFWTADTVFEDGVYKTDLTTVDQIMGIDGSDWATPTLQIIYKNGDEEMIEVSTGQQDISLADKIEKQIMWTSGCMSSRVQEDITPLKKLNRITER